MRHYYGHPPYYSQSGTGIKTVLIITSVVIALILGIYFYAKSQATADITKQLPNQYTNDGTYSDAEGKQIRVMSQSLKDDLQGLHPLGHNYDLYLQLLKLSDKMFVGTMIDYQRIAGGNTFRTDFTGASITFKLWDHLFSSTYDDVISKLNALSIV